MAQRAAARVSRVLLVTAGTLAVGAVGLVAWLTLFSAEAFFLIGGSARWIAAPTGVTSDAIFVDRTRSPTLAFERQLTLASVPQRATLRMRALREASVYVNGKPVARLPEEGASWRQPVEADVAALLRAGSNAVRVEVRNAEGPALLQLWSEGEGLSLESDEQWRVEAPDGKRAMARFANDTQRHPEAVLSPSAGRVASHWLPLCLVLFAAGVALALLAERAPARRKRQLPRLVLGLVSVYWLALFAFKFSGMPVAMGFDIPAHLLYIDFIREHAALPLATDGWSSYHPPLFYLLTTGLVALFDAARESGSGQIVYRLVTMAAGLGNVWLAYAVARRIFDDDPLRTSLATAFAGLLPMNVYMAAYVNNEPLHAALVGLATLLACRLLLSNGAPRAGEMAALAGILGLAMLTKYTALIATVTIPVAIAAKRWAAGEAPLGRAVATGGLLLAGAALVSGWFYARNWLHFGQLLVMNTEALGDVGWWMQPGFHTAGYYASFGEALRYPFFSGFASFWDGVYSTFWGDGLVAGMVRISTRHPFWSYEAMVLVYWVALPATGLLGLGFVRALGEAWQGGDPGRRAALALVTALVFLFGLALLTITIRVPYYAQAKAFYGLAALVPLSVLAALGLAAPLEWLAGPGREPARAAYSGWLGLLAGLLVASFLG